MGTLKMHVLDTSESDEKNVIEKAFDDSFINGLREYILTQPEEQHFYDFQIVCNDNTEVKCHKIILASQTKYFEGLFRQQRSDQIQLDFQSDAVKTCIRYLYTEDLSITGDNVQDILVVANYLLIPKIVRRCVSYILANMDISNCIDILNLGDQLNMPEISSEASDAISFSLGSVFEDENNFKNTPLHLFKSLLSNDNVTLKNSRKVTMTDTKKKVPLADIARRYCTMTNQTGEVEGLLNLINQLPETRNFYQRFKSHRFGTYNDGPRVIRHFDLKRTKEDYIQAVTLRWSVGWCSIGQMAQRMRWGRERLEQCTKFLTGNTSALCLELLAGMWTNSHLSSLMGNFLVRPKKFKRLIMYCWLHSYCIKVVLLVEMVDLFKTPWKLYLEISTCSIAFLLGWRLIHKI